MTRAHREGPTDAVGLSLILKEAAVDAEPQADRLLTSHARRASAACRDCHLQPGVVVVARTQVARPIENRSGSSDGSAREVARRRHLQARMAPAAPGCRGPRSRCCRPFSRAGIGAIVSRGSLGICADPRRVARGARRRLSMEGLAPARCADRCGRSIHARNSVLPDRRMSEPSGRGGVHLHGAAAGCSSRLARSLAAQSSAGGEARPKPRIAPEEPLASSARNSQRPRKTNRPQKTPDREPRRCQHESLRNKTDASKIIACSLLAAPLPD